MPLSAHLNDHLWAIAPDGALFYTASTAPQWRCVGLPVAATTLACCELISTVFVACDDGTLYAFHPVTAELLNSSPSPLHSRPLCLLAVPTENAMFAGLCDGAVVRIHLPSLAFDCMLGCGVEHASAVHALAVDNHYLFSAGDDAIVLVWDIKDLTTVRDFSVSSAPIRSLLRVNFVLWLGLENGSVQVVEIFGDDLNGVTNVSEKRPHSRPVSSLLQVGDSSVWSVEDVPNTVNPNAPYQSHVAIWDIHDFTYVMADELDDMFIRSVAIVNSLPFQRVTVAALSIDLSAKLVVKEVATTSKPKPLPNPSHELYVADLEHQLAQANEHIRFLSVAPSGSTSSALAERQLIEYSNAQPISSSPMPPATPSDVAIDSADDSTQACASKTLDITNACGEAASGNALVLPTTVSDALQATLSNVADLLVSLLTNEVLAAENTKTNARNTEQVSNTVATLTKELSIGRQLVACCASADDAHSAQLLAQLETTASYASSPAHSRPSGTKDTVRDLRRRLDVAVNKADQLESDVRSITNERDLLKEEVQHEREQAERTMSSLEDLLRERNSTIEARESTIAELRAALSRSDEALRVERRARDLVQRSVVEETERLADMGRAAVRAYEEQLKSSYSKIETKSNEIQANRDTIQLMELKMAELRKSNQILEDRCKQIESDLAEATDTVNTARKDLAANIAAKEAQHREAMNTLRHKHDCELQSLSQELNRLRHEYEHFRISSDQTCEALRAELRATRQAEKEGVKTLREKTNQQIEQLKGDLDEAHNRASMAHTRISELEKEHDEIVAGKVRDQELKISNLGKGAEGAQGTMDKIAISRDEDEESQRTNQCDNAVEDSFSKDEGSVMGRGAVEGHQVSVQKEMVENLQHRCEVLESEVVDQNKVIEQLQSQLKEVKTIEEDRKSDDVDFTLKGHELSILREEIKLLKAEVDHRQAAAGLYEKEAENMKGIINDLREATNELQSSLERSEDESRHLYKHLDEMRATMRLRDLRIAQLEGRVAAINCTPCAQGSDGITLLELDANAKATQALLASANGEIEQMGRELEAMYRAQFAREKELQGSHEGIAMRDEKIRARDAVIEDLRSKMKSCIKCGHEAHTDDEWFGDTERSIDFTLARDAHETDESWSSDGLPHVGASTPTQRRRGHGSMRNVETQVHLTLKELEEGMVVTQERLRDVTRLARDYKSLALSHLQVLPALRELECLLARIMSHFNTRGHPIAGQLLCSRGIVQSIIAQYYSQAQKRCVLGGEAADNPEYAASPRRLAALQTTVRKLRAARVASASPSSGVTTGAMVMGAVRRTVLSRRSSGSTRYQQRAEANRNGGGGGGSIEADSEDDTIIPDVVGNTVGQITEDYPLVKGPQLLSV